MIACKLLSQAQGIESLTNSSVQVDSRYSLISNYTRETETRVKIAYPPKQQVNIGTTPVRCTLGCSRGFRLRLSSACSALDVGFQVNL